MIGVVQVERGDDPRVLGLTIAMRAVLALQAAGVERVHLVGAASETVARAARADGRIRIAVDRDEPPAVARCIVAEHVVVDARALRALIAGRATVLSADGALVAGVPDGTPSSAPAEGVVVIARDRAGERVATRALLDSLRKPQDGWVSRALNRHLSLAVTRVLVGTGLRPNPLSVGILAIGLAGGVFASHGTHAGLALGGILFQTQSVLDGCDGEISRLTYRGSRLGEWLDTVGDDLTNYSFYAGAALGLRAAGVGGVLPLAFGAIGLVAGVLASGIEYRYLIRIGSGDLLKYPLGFGNDPDASARPGFVARVLGAIRPAFKRDFFALLTMVAALAGAVPTLIMLALFAGGAVATLSAVVASEIRRARG